MVGPGPAEKFTIACDWGEGRARVALVGTEGAEVLVVFPFDSESVAGPEVRKLVFEEGEARLRAALLAFIGKNWPSDPP